MKLLKKLFVYGLLFFVLVFTFKSASAFDKFDYVSLIENTAKCGSGCYSTYKICGNGETLHLSNLESYFLFHDFKNKMLRDVSLVPDLYSYRLEINDSYVPVGCASNNLSVACAPVQYYRVFAPYDKTVQANECMNLRIRGNKNKNANIDNVLNLKIGGIMYSYPEWVSWNATNVTVWWQFNNSYADDSGNNNLGVIQGSGGSINNTMYKQSSGSFQSSGTGWVTNHSPNGAILGFTDFSLGIWVRRTGVFPSGDLGMFIFGIGDTTNVVNFKGLNLVYYNDSAPAQLRVTGRGFSLTTQVNLDVNQWYHLFVAYNTTSKNVSLYLNNSLLFEKNIATSLDICEGVSDDSCHIDIGAMTHSEGSINTWVGQMDDFRVFDFLLNSTQRINLYNNSNGNGLIDLDVNATGGGGGGGISEGDKFWSNYSFNASFVRETSPQKFYFNITFNTTNVTDTNASFFFNSGEYVALESTVVNSTGMNKTLYNVTVNMPLVETNQTTFNTYWNYWITYNNGSRTNYNTSVETENTIYSYFINELRFNSTQFEGIIGMFNASVTILENSTKKSFTNNNNGSLNGNITLSYGGINYGMFGIMTCPAGTTSDNTTNYEMLYCLPQTYSLNSSEVWTRLLNIPLQDTNNTAINVIARLNLSYNNQSILRNSSGTQNALFSYYTQNFSINKGQIIESETLLTNFTLSWIANSTSTIIANLTFNGINIRPTLVTNTSLSNMFWAYNYSTELITNTSTNITQNIEARASITWNGTTKIRNLTSNLNIFKMMLTNCTSTSVSTNITLFYEVFDEDNPGTRINTNTEETYKVYKDNSTKSRTYGWARNNLNNFSTCIYPTIINVSTYIAEQTGILLGDGTTWARREY